MDLYYDLPVRELIRVALFYYSVALVGLTVLLWLEEGAYYEASIPGMILPFNQRRKTMKSQVWLLEKVLQDCGTRCNVDTARDLITVERRVEKEGVSFLTISLPAYCKGFERALEVGRLTTTLLPGFRFRNGLPLFLRGFLERIFNHDGYLLDDDDLDITSVVAIRQICLLFKKLEMDCTEKRQRKAEEAFLKCESDLKSTKPGPLAKQFKKVAAIVMAECMSSTLYDELVPCHGPGATQEKKLGNSKFLFDTWHTRLETVFPFTEFGVASLRSVGEEWCPLSRVKFSEPRDEQPVRVVFVPKTLKAPRVIAIEPVCMQYAQQALMKWIVPRLERSTIAGGHINFTDQSVNQRLARLSSKDGRFATIDLSEASDRVSSSLVRDMLAIDPVFRDLAFACRSSRATLPSGKTVTLRKFASMGSALCFPMEAVAFFCAIIAIRLDEAKKTVTHANVYKYSREVYVYGDDIIVPANEAYTICAGLPGFGLKVNISKSFWNGKFRESCGTDAYNGVDVTPVYCRHLQPSNRRSVAEVVSWVAMANHFDKKGFYRAAEAVKESVELALRYRLPTLKTISQGLGWTFFSENSPAHRRNKTLFRPEVRTYVVSPVRKPDPLSGDGALLKCLGLIGLKTIDTEHLLQTVRRGASALKLRWVPA